VTPTASLAFGDVTKTAAPLEIDIASDLD